MQTLAYSLRNGCYKQPHGKFLGRPASLLRKEVFKKLPGAAYENSSSFYKCFQCLCQYRANADADAEMPIPKFPSNLK